LNYVALSDAESLSHPSPLPPSPTIATSLRCPQCGARVETTTTNHALLQMVQAILEKRRRFHSAAFFAFVICKQPLLTNPHPASFVPRRIESGDISLTSSHASAPTQASPHRPSTASTGAHGSNAAVLGIIDIAAGSNDADVDKYVGEYRILSVRQRVLENELQDIQVQTAQVRVQCTYKYRICIST
jgi:hypothetical protein